MSVRYSTIAADIKAKLESISGTGIIHLYERQANDLTKFIMLFKTPEGKICGWEITRRGAPERYSGAVERSHNMVIRGYMGLQDATATSVVFKDLCDEICDLFREAQQPNGAIWSYRNTLEPEKIPVQLELEDDRMFGSVLCHHAVISISVSERIF